MPKFWSKTQKYKPNLYKNGIYIYKQIALEKKKINHQNLGFILTYYLFHKQWVTNFGIDQEIDLLLYYGF